MAFTEGPRPDGSDAVTGLTAVLTRQSIAAPSETGSLVNGGGSIQHRGVDGSKGDTRRVDFFCHYFLLKKKKTCLNNNKTAHLKTNLFFLFKKASCLDPILISDIGPISAKKQI